MTARLLKSEFSNSLPNHKGTLFIVSTRPPKFPLSGGMAPAVREASVGYNEVRWFALGTMDGKTEMGMQFMKNIPETAKSTRHDYKVDHFDVTQLNLTKEHWQRHYDECCNRLIWPAFHDLTEYAKEKLEKEDIEGNSFANFLLAQKISEELNNRGDTTSHIFCQDYHHFTLARYMRREGVQNPLSFFNHTPLPSKQTYDNLPSAEKAFVRDMMHDLLEYDSVHFQTEQTLHDFLYIIGHKNPMPHVPAYNAIIIDSGNGRHVRVGHAPISVNADKIMKIASWPEQPDAEPTLPEEQKGAAIANSLEDELVAENILLNFERCDYSKGILERVEAYSKLMEERPELRGKVQLVLQAEPTRTDIAEYQNYARRVKELADRTNKIADLRVGGKDPIIFLNQNIPNSKLLKIMSREKYVDGSDGQPVLQKRIGTVTPHKDGMNLTAKEFAASQNVTRANPLILSRGAGAAAELDLGGQGALVYTPVKGDITPLANVMYRAITMPQDEANARAQKMRDAILSNTIQHWGAYFDEEPKRIVAMRADYKIGPSPTGQVFKL
jgi:trehalose 6-phosphate synthase